MKIIEDLYYGRISPYEMNISAAPEYPEAESPRGQERGFIERIALRRTEGNVRETHRNCHRHILDLRAGYVYQWLPAWREDDD